MLGWAGLDCGLRWERESERAGAGADAGAGAFLAARTGGSVYCV